jgi:V8-like Glu-specific endopeptidase
MIGGQSWQGSGVLISPDEVLTASHVVYIEGEGTASNIVVTPGYNLGSSPYGSAQGTYIQYFQIDDADRSISNYQSQDDYALIHLSSPFESAGTMGIESNFGGGSVNITGYPASAGGSQVDSSQTVTLDPIYTLLDGTALGEGSSGGPVWIETNAGPEVVGIVSSESDITTTGYNTLITTSVFNQIEEWLASDDGSGAAGSGTTGSGTSNVDLSVEDTTISQPITPSIQSYTGPVAGIQEQYINMTSDGLNITASSPNWFVHSGSGDDAIAVTSGTNVLDGGTGSNFLTGGSGTDTFFVDDRGPSSDIWSTVANFHAGDAATIFGITQQGFGTSWVDGQGAAGYTGLTLHVTASGHPTASLTLAGFSAADLSNGRISTTWGTEADGTPYLYVHENS